MTSNDNRDLDGFLDRQITTAEDVAALNRVRELDRLDPFSYLEFLVEFSQRHPPTREIPSRHEPFRL